MQFPLYRKYPNCTLIEPVTALLFRWAQVSIFAYNYSAWSALATICTISCALLAASMSTGKFSNTYKAHCLLGFGWLWQTKPRSCTRLEILWVHRLLGLVGCEGLNSVWQALFSSPAHKKEVRCKVPLMTMGLWEHANFHWNYIY